MSSSTVHAAIDDVLRQAVDAGSVPNVVAIAANREGIIYEGAAGMRTPLESDPATPDTRFRIMSMTKMVATTAALQLVERAKLDLDAPVEEYCPEFAKLQVLEGIDGDRLITRAPASKATVRQLITHTAGLGYWFWSPDVFAWEQATATPNVLSGSEAIFNAPLVADPGTRFIYGINTDWLGRVVEVAGGTSLDRAIADGITGPLGMSQTKFTIEPDEIRESTPVHLKGDDGRWMSSEIELASEPDWWAGGHGLYSTPRDYLKFQRALLGDGTAPDGTKILEPATVQAAFTNQIGDLDFPAEIPTADPNSTFGLTVGPGYKWGLGLLLNTHDQPGRRRAGSGAWAGFFNCHYWVDRTAGVTGAIYSQFLPFILPEAMQLYADFETALYAAL